MSLAHTLITLLGVCLTRNAARGSTTPRPVCRQLRVATDPDHASQRALRTVLGMGGQLTQHNPRTRFLSAHLPHAVVLHVLVMPTGAGARIDVQGTVLPDTMVCGACAAVDDFLAVYQQQA